MGQALGWEPPSPPIWASPVRHRASSSRGEPCPAGRIARPSGQVRPVEATTARGAAQNAVEYRLLGVATSGSTLFRQVGGSVGVSLFGAIFANRLAHELAARLPLGAHLPAAANPAAVRRRQA